MSGRDLGDDANRSGGSPRCHVPARFDPRRQNALSVEVKNLIQAAEWLSRELAEDRGCHAAPLQVSALQSDLDGIAAKLVDGHFRYCVTYAAAERHDPDEIYALLVPVQSLLFTRR